MWKFPNPNPSRFYRRAIFGNKTTERFSTDPQHEGRSLAENVSPFSGKKDTVLRGKEFYASVKKNVWPTANLHSLTRKIRQSGAFM